MFFRNKSVIRPDQPRGSQHYRAKFSDDEVMNIRHLRASGMSYSRLAEQYMTRSDTIRNLCLGYTYSNVPGPLARGSPGLTKRRYDDIMVKKIQAAYHGGMSYKKLCEEFDVGMVAAHRIVRGEL